MSDANVYPGLGVYDRHKGINMITEPLTVCAADSIPDWWIIERRHHRHEYKIEQHDGYQSMLWSGRVSDADIEGTSEEMRWIAGAITARKSIGFNRCAVDATNTDGVRLWSPRNSQEVAIVSFDVADELARQIAKGVTA